MQDQLVSKYKILEIITEGSMGKVFKGIDLLLEREVAIKSLYLEYASRPNIVERFSREAKALAMLHHPNIVNVYDFFRQGDNFFIVTEFVYGETLDEMIAREKVIPWKRAVPLLCQALKSIGHAHSYGIIHGNIKPTNMIITKSGLLKVMDFRITQVSRTTHIIHPGHLVGKIEYMSPEQIQGRDVDTRSDIYSLGIVFYEMLAGHTPFADDSGYELLRAQVEEAPKSVRQLASDVPPELEALFAHVLAKQPEQRLQTVDEFRERMENLLDGTWSEAARRQAEEVARRQAEKEQARRQGEEEQARRQGEEKQARRQAEKAARRRAEEERARRQAEEEQARRQAEEEQTRRLAEEKERARRQAEKEQIQLQAEKERARRQAEEAARRQAEKPKPLLNKLVWGAGLVTILAVIATAILYFYSWQIPPPTPDQIAALLARAEAQFKAKRLTEPAGDNAAATYRQVLQRDAGNAKAQAGLERIAREYLRQVQEQRSKGALQESLKLIDKGLAVLPNQAELLRLRGEVQEKQQREQEIAALLARAEAQFEAKRLAEPAGNNAAATYRQVLEFDASNAQAQAGLERIAREYLQQAQQQRSAGALQESLKLIDKGLAVLPNQAELRRLQEEVSAQLVEQQRQEEQQREQQKKLEQQRLEQQRLEQQRKEQQRLEQQRQEQQRKLEQQRQKPQPLEQQDRRNPPVFGTF